MPGYLIVWFFRSLGGGGVGGGGGEEGEAGGETSPDGGQSGSAGVPSSAGQPVGLRRRMTRGQSARRLVDKPQDFQVSRFYGLKSR